MVRIWIYCTHIYCVKLLTPSKQLYMPYSSKLLDSEVLNILKEIKPSKVYDIGAGAGKYGLMIRKNTIEVERLICIEIDKDYIEKFKLNNIYDEVLQMSAMDLISEKFYDTNFDTVVIGDCIEHLKKSDGIDLLNFLVYRTKWILVQYPIKYLQNTFEGKHQEAHISIWDDKDFDSFEIKKKLEAETQRFILIKGYL